MRSNKLCKRPQSEIQRHLSRRRLYTSVTSKQKGLPLVLPFSPEKGLSSRAGLKGAGAEVCVGTLRRMRRRRLISERKMEDLGRKGNLTPFYIEVDNSSTISGVNRR